MPAPLYQALDYGVHVEMSDLQLGAAEALEEPVYEAEGAEVGAHPAVLPHALEHRQGCAGDHEAHALEVVQPGEVVHHGVVETATGVTLMLCPSIEALAMCSLPLV